MRAEAPVAPAVAACAFVARAASDGAGVSVRRRTGRLEEARLTTPVDGCDVLATGAAARDAVEAALGRVQQAFVDRGWERQVALGTDNDFASAFAFAHGEVLCLGRAASRAMTGPPGSRRRDAPTLRVLCTSPIPRDLGK